MKEYLNKEKCGDDKVWWCLWWIMHCLLQFNDIYDAMLLCMRQLSATISQMPLTDDVYICFAQMIHFMLLVRVRVNDFQYSI